MSDVFTPAKRSEVMSLIRSRGNKGTELRMIILMRAAAITGWRRHVKLGAGKVRAGRATGSKAKTDLGSRPLSAHSPLTVRPDFVFRAQRVVVFIDGCFWHGCPRHATRPRQNRKFWDAKFARNKARDRAVTRGLRKEGWTVLRIWECALTIKRAPATLRRLQRALLLKSP